MMQAADLWTLQDLARRWKLDWPEVGCVLVERKVRARLMVIDDVAGEDSAQVSFTEHEHVIQILAADRPIKRSTKGLPEAVGRRENSGDSHASHPFPEGITAHGVTVAEEIGGC